MSKATSFFICLSLLTSCAREDVTKPRQPLNEAYRLMDKGENAKAVFLLEDFLKNEPSNKEARLLAASAYMGEAGVDIFHSYESFKDILFNMPLGDRLGGGPSHAPEFSVPPMEAPIEKIIYFADLVLGKVKHILSFLSRFPKVERHQWPMVDRALEHMEVDEPTNDERLYRTFIRVVYLKSFLDQEVINDAGFGSTVWLCSANFLSLRDGFIWNLKHLQQVTTDLKQVFPDKKGEILVLHDAIKAILDALENKTPTGAKTMILGVEQAMKELFRCKSIQK